MEYLGPKDFINRIDSIFEKNKDDQYDFTVLIMTLLAVVDVVKANSEVENGSSNNKEYKIEYKLPIADKSPKISAILKNEINRDMNLQNYGDYYISGLKGESAVYGDLIRHLRNSLAHALFKEITDGLKWVGIEFNDINSRGQITMKLKLTEKDVFDLYKEIVRLAQKDLKDNVQTIEDLKER